MFKKLRNRLLLLNMAIISFVMIAAFTTIYLITYTNIHKDNMNRLESVPIMTRDMTTHQLFPNSSTQPADRRIVIRTPTVEHTISFVIWINDQGKLMDVLSFIDMPDQFYYQIADRVWSSTKTDGKISSEDRKWQYKVSSLENKRVTRQYIQTKLYTENRYYQITFLDITESSRTLTQLLLTFLLVGVAMLFILFWVCYYFATRSIRPIEENWEKQKQFVADASHELKTPLAIIHANTEALLTNEEETVISQKKWINYIQSEIGRMTKLVNDMLYLAKVENKHIHQMPVDLSHTVFDVIASMEVVAYEKGITLNQEIQPNIMVYGDADRLKQAVIILLDNAVKYTNQNGTIDITLKKRKSYSLFSIKNSGPGIPEDKLTRIFDRFYRIDSSRSTSTGGYGLGLSIAKAIIERSGGDIFAESTEYTTTFSFQLKLS